MRAALVWCCLLVSVLALLAASASANSITIGQLQYLGPDTNPAFKVTLDVAPVQFDQHSARVHQRECSGRYHSRKWSAIHGIADRDIRFAGCSGEKSTTGSLDPDCPDFSA